MSPPSDAQRLGSPGRLFTAAASPAAALALSLGLAELPIAI